MAKPLPCRILPKLSVIEPSLTSCGVYSGFNNCEGIVQVLSEGELLDAYLASMTKNYEIRPSSLLNVGVPHCHTLSTGTFVLKSCSIEMLQ